MIEDGRRLGEKNNTLLIFGIWALNCVCELQKALLNVGTYLNFFFF